MWSQRSAVGWLSAGFGGSNGEQNLKFQRRLFRLFRYEPPGSCLRGIDPSRMEAGLMTCPRCGSLAHRDCRRRSWPWWIVAIAALLLGVLPSLIVGLMG